MVTLAVWNLFNSHTSAKTASTRMWANAQRDGRPAEYRWRPLFNAAKFGWRPILECRAVTLPRRETRWNLQGCPQTPEPISAASGPKFTILWEYVEEILLLNNFFRLPIRALVAKIQPYKVVRWCPDGDFLKTLRPVFAGAPCSMLQTCILN